MNAINGNNTRQYSSDPDIDRLYQEDLDMQIVVANREGDIPFLESNQFTLELATSALDNTKTGLCTGRKRQFLHPARRSCQCPGLLQKHPVALCDACPKCGRGQGIAGSRCRPEYSR